MPLGGAPETPGLTNLHADVVVRTVTCQLQYVLRASDVRMCLCSHNKLRAVTVYIRQERKTHTPTHDQE